MNLSVSRKERDHQKQKAMTHSSGVNARQPTYDAIIKKTFTEINEQPTKRQKVNLLVEVKKVLVGVSVPGFNWASRYGLLAETR